MISITKLMDDDEYMIVEIGDSGIKITLNENMCDDLLDEEDMTKIIELLEEARNEFLERLETEEDNEEEEEDEEGRGKVG